MKKILLIMIIALTSTFTFAQSSVTNNFFNKYAGKDGFTTVNVTGKLMELLASAEAEGSAQYEDVIKKIKGINILVYDQANKKYDADKLYNEIFSSLQKNYYSELLTVKDGTDNVRLLVKDSPKKGVISELLMLVSSDDEFVFINIDGEIDLAQINEISKSIKVDGIEHLDKVKDKK